MVIEKFDKKVFELKQILECSIEKINLEMNSLLINDEFKTDYDFERYYYLEGKKDIYISEIDSLQVLLDTVKSNFNCTDRPDSYYLGQLDYLNKLTLGVF
jgi:hypothetical protein